jgi:DNA polymerase III epsilon subunit-like protein
VEGTGPAPEALLQEPPAALQALAFAVVDLETTGHVPKGGWNRQDRFHAGAEITEVGVVRLSGRIVQGRFQSLCAVERGVPGLIQRLTGITPALLEGAPAWDRVALTLAPELEGRVWVAHNARFDGAFLKAYLPEGLWRRHALLCTLKLAKHLVPEASSRSLSSLCALLDISNRRAHRALSDAEATAELLGILMDRAAARGWDAEAFLQAGAVRWEGL